MLSRRIVTARPLRNAAVPIIRRAALQQRGAAQQAASGPEYPTLVSLVIPTDDRSWANCYVQTDVEDPGMVSHLGVHLYWI